MDDARTPRAVHTGKRWTRRQLCKARAMRNWKRLRRLYSAAAIDRLMDEVRDALVEQCGPVRHLALRPNELVMEEFYAAGDYAGPNAHTEVNVLQLQRALYARTPGEHFWRTTTMIFGAIDPR